MFDKKEKIQTRYLMFAFLTLIFLVIAGESNCQCVWEDESLPHFPLYEYTGNKNFESLDDELRGYGVSIVVVDDDDDNRCIEIYGDEDSVSEYMKLRGITQTPVRSCFLGDITVKTYSLSELDADSLNQNDPVYLISSGNVMRQIPLEWIKENCEDIRNGYEMTKYSEILKICIGLWLAACFFVSVNEISDMKKELFLRVAMGEAKWRRIAGWMLKDVAVYTVLWALITFFACNITYITDIRLICLAFAVFIALICLYYVLMSRSYYKKIWGAAENISLAPAYSLLWIALMTVMTYIFVINLAGLREYQQNSLNRAFFGYYDEAYDVTLSGTEMTDELYLYGAEAGKTSLFLQYGSEGGKEVLMYDAGSLEWLLDRYPDLAEGIEKNGLLVIYPEGLSAESLDDGSLFLFDYDKDSVKFVSYSCDILAPGMNGNNFAGSLEWFENPVFAVDMRSNQTDHIGELMEDFAFYYRGAYLIEDYESIGLPDDVLNNTTFGLVSKEFERNQSSNIRQLKWDMAVIALIVLLDVVLSLKLLQDIFENSARKYILQKIHGRGFFKNYSGIFIITIVCAAVSYLLSSSLLKEEGYGTEIQMLFIFLVCVHLVLNALHITRLEHIHTIRIFKGDSLW